MHKFPFLFLILTVLALQGCAHKAAEKRVDDKLAVESVKDSGEIRAEVSKMIGSAPGLSLDQRKQLMDLHVATMTEMSSLREQSAKLRGVLVDEVITENYDADVVVIIKNRLRKVEDRRLTLLFNTVEKANHILGHSVVGNAKLVSAMFHQQSARSL